MPDNVKRAVLEMIQRLPEDVTIEEIAAKIFFRQQVDEGLRQLDAGEGVVHEEAGQRLAKWADQSDHPAR
jgi:predicted transcriptional regulator